MGGRRTGLLVGSFGMFRRHESVSGRTLGHAPAPASGDRKLPLTNRTMVLAPSVG
jgi:hypothetical protein